MTEQEYQKALEAGNVDHVQPPASVIAQPQIPETPDIEDYLPILDILRRPKIPLSAVPTFVPKSFADSIQWIDDGTSKRPGFYIGDQWIDLATLIPALAPQFDPFAQFLDIVHWDIADINSVNVGFNLIKPSGTGSVLIQDGQLLLATAAAVNTQDGLASKAPYKGLNTTGKRTSVEWIILGMDNGSGVAGFPMTNCEIRLYFTGDSGTPTDTAVHFGFRLVGASDLTILGTCADGTTETTTTLDTGNFRTGTQFTRLRADYTPGTGCDFYINGQLKGTITTNLPGTADLGHNLTLKTLANTQKEVDLGRILMQKIY